MEGIIIETVKIDKISQRKRLLCYWYFFQKMQNSTVSEVWSDYENLLEATENWHKYYEEFLGNESIDEENKMIDEFYVATGNKDKSVQKTLKKTWEKVRTVIKKEIDCEKKLHDILNDKADDHPIISKIIIAILMGILLGLIEDCIHDVIQSKSAQRSEQVTNIYITDVNNNYTQILYEDNKIVIKETK